MAEIETPELILAVQLKIFEQVRSLLEKEDINVNITDNFGDSALHYAAANNQLEILNLLIEKGANVNIQNNTGATPLHKAAGRNNRKIIETLLPKVDTSIKTNSGLLAEQFTSDNDIWKTIIGQNNLKREKIFVENDNLGTLIGKNGKNLQQLQTSSNTKIIVHKNNATDRGSTEVSITGREESIAIAKDLINDAIKPKPSKQEQLLEEENISHKVKVATKIPRNKFGRIIGAKGKKIAEIEESFGVKVVIPKFQDDDVVNIYGEDSSSVQEALNFIFELVKDKPRENNNNRNNNSNNNNRNNNSNNNNGNNNNNRNNNRSNGEGRRNSPKGASSPTTGGGNAQVIHKDNTVVIKTNNYLRINSK